MIGRCPFTRGLRSLLGWMVFKIMRLFLRYTREKEEICSTSFQVPSLYPCPMKFSKCVMTYMIPRCTHRTLLWPGNPVSHGIPFFLGPFQPLWTCSLFASLLEQQQQHPVRVNNSSSIHKREINLLKANSVIKILLVQQGWTQKHTLRLLDLI